MGKLLVKKLKTGYHRLEARKGFEEPVPVTARTPLPTTIESPLEVVLAGSRGGGVGAGGGSRFGSRGGVESDSAFKGIEIPTLPKSIRFGKLQMTEEKPLTTIIYPLIPDKPKKGDAIFAYTKISWDAKGGGYVYQTVEPNLTPILSDILKKIKGLLEQRLDIDFSRLKMVEASEYLSKQIGDLINYFKFQITPAEKTILKYYIERDFIGLGKIEPLMKDKNIEDISCDGIGIPIFIYHRNPVLGSVGTNIVFETEDELDSFLARLVQLSGKSISVSQPLIDGTLPDGSRLQATLATDIARRGSNFTIRKFSEEPLTPIHLLNYGTVDVRTLAYLWLAVEFGRSLLISGGTASGKTSFLNALSLFIRPEKKIVSIEDTAELRLPHPHWIPTVARIPISVEGGRLGEVDMFDLLKESLRQRPDYIIVGEVRGKEAYILFQQIATGHPSMATIHAENLTKLVDRLTTQPISLPKTLVSSLDIVVFLLRVRHKNRYVRKVNEVLEMVKFDPEASEPLVNQIFKWNPVGDTFEVSNKSVILQRISDVTGVNPQELVDEMERRSLILDWMQRKNVTDYRSVHQVIDMYYSHPKQLLAKVMGES